MDQKKSAINLILAFSVATKHFLRGESGIDHEDLNYLIKFDIYKYRNIPAFREKLLSSESCEGTATIPLEITFHLSAYNQKARQNEQTDAPTTSNMITAVSGIVDCLGLNYA
jgi:putative membrane protein